MTTTLNAWFIRWQVNIICGAIHGILIQKDMINTVIMLHSSFGKQQHTGQALAGKTV